MKKHLSMETLFDAVQKGEGYLSPEAQKHLSDCAACRLNLERQRAMDLDLRGLEPLQAPLDLEDKVMARLTTTSVSNRFKGIKKPSIPLFIILNTILGYVFYASDFWQVCVKTAGSGFDIQTSIKEMILFHLNGNLLVDYIGLGLFVLAFYLLLDIILRRHYHTRLL